MEMPRKLGSPMENACVSEFWTGKGQKRIMELIETIDN
jgi:hypothetical protein